MSIIFNEAALVHFLEAPNGPYGNRLRLVAETVTENYNAAIGGVWENQPRDIQAEADFDIDIGPYGLQAVIGIVNPGVVRKRGRKTISQVIADKFDGLERDKFKARIMAGWDAQL